MKTDIEYSVVQNELKLGKGNSKGLTELALTKENIVMLQRDIEVEGELPKPKSPRDISTLPRSLFVYDYDLNLKKIIKKKEESVNPSLKINYDIYAINN